MSNRDWRPELQRRLAPLALTPVREAEIIEELSAHLDDRWREHRASGISDVEARRLALAELSDADLLARRLAAVESPAPNEPLIARRFRGIGQDVRYGLRTLRKNPGFAAAALLMLALGTGANAAMFSVVDAVVVRSVFRDQARIVEVLDRQDPRSEGVLRATPEDVSRLRNMTEVFDSVSTLDLAQPTLTGAGEPQRLDIQCVSASMFRVLSVQPVIGRAFGDDEDRPGGEPVIVIGDRLWRQMFGGSADAIGRSITLDGRARTVIGVMAPDFDGPRVGRAAAWTPINQGSLPGATGCQSAGAEVYARIRSDLTLSIAQVRLQGITGGTRGLMSLDDANLGTDRTMLLTLLAAVSFVLLIACANVANLLLERAVRRRREIATRLALGASPARLVRQMLTESVLLSTLGTLAGLVAARLVLGALVALLPGGLPHVSRIALNLRVLIVAIATGALAGLVAGVVPALQASSRGLTAWLLDARAVTLPSRSWARRALVIAEVALSVALLVGATLTTRSFLTLRPTHPGFDPADKIVAGTRLQGARYQSPAARLAFLDEWTGRLAHLPGVSGVSIVNFPPFGGLTSSRRIVVTGRPDTDDGHLSIETSMVSANYFDEMRMSIRRGRGFLSTDDTRAMPVAIVSEALATSVWPGADPIGAVITAKMRTGDSPPRVVVGVVSDIRTFAGSTRVTPQLYLPMSQEPSVYANVIVRTAGPPASDLASMIRREAASIDPLQVVDPVTSFDDILARSQGGRRFVTWLMAAFAAMALGLAIVGLAAVIGASVAQRTREIGIRIALGARPGAVVRLVLGQAMVLAGCGVVIGLGLAVATTRFLANSLYGVTPLDRPTFAVAAALMLLVATAASYLPARRATEVDPLVALRAE